MERLSLVNAERTWRTVLRAAARHWQAGEYDASFNLQTEALIYAEQTDTTWALLWSCAQLGICHALMGDPQQARHALSRATHVAVGNGQGVVGGVCATIEALCAMFPGQGRLPAEAHRSLCSLQHGLMEYLYFNRLPMADVCWQISVPAGAAAIAAEQRPRSQVPQPKGQPEVRVTFLGKFGICIDGQPLANLPLGRGGTLLKYLLANHGRLVRSDVLLEQFWPEVDPDVSRNRFHYTMHCLRRALALATDGSDNLQIVYSEGRYGFPLEQPIWIDIEAFKHLVVTGRQAEQAGWLAQAMAAYREALSLYRGDFLPEDCYEDWTSEIRSFLSESHLDVLDRLSRMCIIYNDYSAALDYCSQLLARDNCREDIYQRLMWCYAALGQRAQALRQYERCVRALQDELGLKPLPETTKLYHEIKEATDAHLDLTPLKRLIGVYAES